MTFMYEIYDADGVAIGRVGLNVLMKFCGKTKHDHFFDDDLVKMFNEMKHKSGSEDRMRKVLVK